MSRRKVLLIIVGLTALALGLGFFIPEPAYNPQHLLAFLEPRAEEPAACKANADPAAIFELEVRVFALPIFSDDAKHGRRTCGVVKDLKHLLAAVQNEPCAHIITNPRIASLNGQPSSCSVGTTRNEVAADGVTLLPKNYGTKLDVTVTLRTDGRMHVQIDWTDNSWDERLPNEIAEASGSFVLKDHETGYIAGMKRKQIERSEFCLPILHELPAIGSCFRFDRQREIEMEYVILATPKHMPQRASK